MHQSRIQNLLNRLGVSSSSKGYPYLVHAIYLVMTDCSHYCPVMKYLYFDIAEHFGTSPTAVQYAIRIMLEAHHTPQYLQSFSELTGYPANHTPTPKEFIAILADYLLRSPDES